MKTPTVVPASSSSRSRCVRGNLDDRVLAFTRNLLPVVLHAPLLLSAIHDDLRKQVGKLVKKYMKVVPVPNRRRSGRLSLSPKSSSRGSSRCSGSDDDYWDADDAPAGVPEGCLAVYVGPEMQRFVIQASFLYNQVFRELLRRSEEEYGFETEGGLRIPCEAGDFEQLLWQMEREDNNDDNS